MCHAGEKANTQREGATGEFAGFPGKLQFLRIGFFAPSDPEAGFRKKKPQGEGKKQQACHDSHADRAYTYVSLPIIRQSILTVL